MELVSLYIYIYIYLIRPVITYATDAWTLNTETTKRLAVFERKIFRRILGAVKINDTWRRRNNSKLMNLYEDENII